MWVLENVSFSCFNELANFDVSVRAAPIEGVVDATNQLDRFYPVISYRERCDVHARNVQPDFLFALYQFWFGPLFGHLFDAYGPRLLLIAGSCLFITSLFLVSIFQEYYQLVCVKLRSILGSY